MVLVKLPTIKSACAFYNAIKGELTLANIHAQNQVVSSGQMRHEQSDRSSSPNGWAKEVEQAVVRC